VGVYAVDRGETVGVNVQLLITNPLKSDIPVCIVGCRCRHCDVDDGAGSYVNRLGPGRWGAHITRRLTPTSIPTNALEAG